MVAVLPIADGYMSVSFSILSLSVLRSCLVSLSTCYDCPIMYLVFVALYYFPPNVNVNILALIILWTYPSYKADSDPFLYKDNIQNSF